jgi:hypothetical protein
MNHMHYNPNRLSERFASAIEGLTDERLHGANRLDDEMAQVAEEQAKMLLQGASDIVSGKSVRRAQSLLKNLIDQSERAEANARVEAVTMHVDELLGEEVVTMQAVAEDRLLRLLLLGAQQRVGWEASELLREVSKCYLFGFDRQCTILCRSVLEAALGDACPDQICRTALGKVGPFRLCDRIGAATLLGKLPDNLDRLADFVRKTANRMLHARSRGRALKPQETEKVLLATIQVVAVLAK